MEQLRNYLSTLPVAEQADFARRAGTSIGYLRKALCVGGRFGGVLARRLDEASNGAISRHALRPDIFGSAELAEASSAVSKHARRADGFGLEAITEEKEAVL